MVRYVLLLKFTDKGINQIQDSPGRAEAFKKAAAQAGATIEAQFWTLGKYDGVIVFNAPDENVGVALALNLGKLGFVRTSTLRAFQADEFKNLLTKMP
jgi:uncharacterized protein with GYD domain